MRRQDANRPQLDRSPSKGRLPERPPVRLPYDVLVQIFAQCDTRTHHRDGSREWSSARLHAESLLSLCLVSKDFRGAGLISRGCRLTSSADSRVGMASADYFQPLLWGEISLGDVSDEVERKAILSFIATARARPGLAARITVIRLIKPHRPPAGPPSASSLAADKALTVLCQALSRFPSLTAINLPGPMTSAYLAMDASDVPLLVNATLSGPPSDTFLGLRNLQTVKTLRLDHPWLATPAFLDRIHIQLESLTALHLNHFSLPTAHPVLSFLLGGPFGRRLTELSIHLSPVSPSPAFSAHMLSLVPHLTYLSLLAEGIDIQSLPLFAHLRWLHLHDSHLDPQRLVGILDSVFNTRAADATHRPLPALRAVQIDGNPAAESTLALASVGIALLGPDEDIVHDGERVIYARLSACSHDAVVHAARCGRRKQARKI